MEAYARKRSSYEMRDRKSKVNDQGAFKDSVHSVGCIDDLKPLAGKYGTPLYVFDRSKLLSNLKKYAMFTDVSRIAYPIKTNPSYEVLKTLAREGAGADCASFSEVERALRAGFLPGNMLYNTPAPEYEHIESMIRLGITLVADSVSLLDHLASLSTETVKLVKLFVRVNPEVPLEYIHKEDWQSMTSHGSPNSKFGIPGEELVKILIKYSIPVSGLHIHVGTQMDHTGSFVSALKYLHEIAEDINTKTDHCIHHINIGGGLGLDMLDNGSYPKIEDFVNILNGELKKEYSYWIEPGSSLVGDTVSLLTKVAEMKSVRGKKWGIVDVGTDQLLTVSLMGWSRKISTMKGPLSRKGPDSIGGPLCFAGDVLLPATDLTGVNRGDLLLIENVGSYCFAVSTNFNGRYYHGMAVREGDGTFVLVDEPYDEFYSAGSVSHNWTITEGIKENLILDKVRALQSNYLHHEIAHDSYEIINVVKKGRRSFNFRIKADAKVPFVSLALATRIMSDIGIVSVMKAADKEAKDVSVWGDKMILNAPHMINLKRGFDCEVNLSDEAFDPEISQTKGIASFKMDGGKFSGAISYVYRVER